ncbi:MAG: hypothetical protein NVSMB14_16980 [Isosphaeraceae bacterium]
MIAGDADEAGERRAKRWLETSPSAIRIAPPAGADEKGKPLDWTKAAAAGIDLRRFWRDRMNFEVFGLSRLTDWRWGPALYDSPPSEENDESSTGAI